MMNAEHFPHRLSLLDVIQMYETNSMLLVSQTIRRNCVGEVTMTAVLSGQEKKTFLIEQTVSSIDDTVLEI